MSKNSRHCVNFFLLLQYGLFLGNQKSSKNFHYYIQLTRGIIFLKVIKNHDFLRGLLIRFFGSSRRAHLWALQERD